MKRLVLGVSVVLVLAAACHAASDAPRAHLDPTAPASTVPHGHTPPTPDAPPDPMLAPESDGGDLGDGGPLDPRIAKLVTYAKSAVSRGAVPGAAFAVVREGKLFWAGGVGTRKLGGTELIDGDTLFRAASMSKMVAAATIESLVQDGSLDTHAPVTRYTTGFYLEDGFDPALLTLDELLSHTAALPDSFPLTCRESTRADWFAHVEMPLWAPPGHVWNYSNTNFTLAGFVAETVAGKPYEQLVADRVFGPAGMTTATFDAASAMRRGNYATGRAIDARGTSYDAALTDISCVAGMPPGGVIASVTDYAHLVETLLAGGGTMLSRERTADMMTPRIDRRDYPTGRYALGLMHDDWRRNVPLIWHGGDVPGFHSELGFLPTENVGVVVMVNGDSTTVGVADAIMTYGLGLFASAPESTVVTRTPVSAWAAYPGVYVDTHGSLGRVAVALSDAGVLTALVSSVDAGVGLRQLAGDTWFFPSPISLTGTFWREDSGVVSYFVTRAGVGARVVEDASSDAGSGDSGGSDRR